MRKYKTYGFKPDELSKAMNTRGRDYARELVRQRDKRTCQMCNRRWSEGQRRFDVHHLYDCGAKSKAYDTVDDLDGLITYCHRCHMRLHIVRQKIISKTGNFKYSKESHQHPFYRDRKA